MKPLFVFLAILLTSMFCSCSNSSENSKALQSEEQKPPVELVEDLPKDTSFYYIKRILNAPPSEVKKTLGNPDKPIKKSKDCDYLPNCMETTYQNGNVEVLYYNNMLKWISVENIQGKYYDNNAITMLNFPKSDPDLQTNFFKHWKSYDGIKLIGIFAKSNTNPSVDYILVNVEEDYNERFDVLSDDKLNAQTEILKQDDLSKRNSATERRQRIEAQFNQAIDGSHIALTKRIKSDMNNKSSYEHLSTKFFDLGDNIKVVTTFSGDNKLGVKVKNTAIAIIDIQGNIIEVEYKE